MKIRIIFFIFISQTSYTQLSKKDVENFEELSNSAVLIDDILVNTYLKSSKEISSSFFEVVNKDEDFLTVADKKFHRFIPVFYKNINNKVSVYVILQHETSSNSKYVYALIFKENKCVNLRRIYCNSDVYKPQYNKKFGAQLKGNTIRLFDIKNGFFEMFKINDNGEIQDDFSEKIIYNEPIYNTFFDYYSQLVLVCQLALVCPRTLVLDCIEYLLTFENKNLAFATRLNTGTSRTKIKARTQTTTLTKL